MDGNGARHVFFPQDFSGHHIQFWNSMDGNGAKWHYIMETNMAYYGWNWSQMALYNGNGHRISWIETEPNGII